MAAFSIMVEATEATNVARRRNHSVARQRPTGYSVTFPRPGRAPVLFSKGSVSPAEGFEGCFGNRGKPLTRKGTLATSSVGGLVRRSGVRAAGSYRASRGPRRDGRVAC